MSWCAVQGFDMDRILEQAQGVCAAQVFDMGSISQNGTGWWARRHPASQLLCVRLKNEIDVFQLELACQPVSGKHLGHAGCLTSGILKGLFESAAQAVTYHCRPKVPASSMGGSCQALAHATTLAHAKSLGSCQSCIRGRGLLELAR